MQNTVLAAWLQVLGGESNREVSGQTVLLSDEALGHLQVWTLVCWVLRGALGLGVQS